MAANRLRRLLPAQEWSITVVDQSDSHCYQPGLLFVPFGTYTPQEIVKPRAKFLADGVRLLTAAVELVDAESCTVHLHDGPDLSYDQLVIATGTSARPDATPGMAEAMGGDVHEFYTLPGATALAAKLATWPGGRLVVHISEMPIKCPVAPLEFAFLAESYFTDRKMRDRVEIVYVTPLEGAFTKPVSSKYLGSMLAERKIALEADFMIESVDGQSKKIVSYDGREIDYDLLVTVPVNMGADFIARSGLGDDLNYVPVDRGTLLSLAHDNIFAIGDASNIPASKAGSVAHFSMDAFGENFARHVQGLPMESTFDGHANCFIETGHRKGMLIDFNYDTQPLRGRYPLAHLGPFSLLKESSLNHMGKVSFRWFYWNVLLPGRKTPIPSRMSMAGKLPES